MTDAGDDDHSAARDPEVGAPLPLPFYLQDTLLAARLLLGKHLVRSGRGPRLVLRIVETEAYPPHDPASHAAGGPRGRAEVMFERGGIAYVYLIYGMHHCFNVVTGPGGTGAAVLIRAGEPCEGVDLMWRNRFPSRPYQAHRIHTLANGPGKLTRAMGISREDNHRPLWTGRLTIHDGPELPEHAVCRGPRVGIRRAVDCPWRYSIRGNPCVSRG